MSHANELLSASNEIPQKLTRREVDVIRWVREGKTAWEVGQILDVSESCIRYHLKNIYAKLNASGKAHAIAKAMEQGNIFN